jgi:hypothetical protein
MVTKLTRGALFSQTQRLEQGWPHVVYLIFIDSYPCNRELISALYDSARRYGSVLFAYRDDHSIADHAGRTASRAQEQGGDLRSLRQT